MGSTNGGPGVLDLGHGVGKTLGKVKEGDYLGGGNFLRGLEPWAPECGNGEGLIQRGLPERKLVGRCLRKWRT